MPIYAKIYVSYNQDNKLVLSCIMLEIAKIASWRTQIQSLQTGSNFKRMFDTNKMLTFLWAIVTSAKWSEGSEDAPLAPNQRNTDSVDDVFKTRLWKQ